MRGRKRVAVAECYTEYLLLEVMGVPHGRRKHQSGLSESVKAVVKGAAEVALIDEDPGKPQPKAIKEHFVPTNESDYLVVLEHKRKTGGVLIRMRPDFEGLVVRLCRECGVDPAELSLPSEEDALRREIRQRIGDRRFRDRVRNLLLALKEAKSDAFTTLERVLVETAVMSKEGM